jgi:hypothetical protein
MTCKSSQITSFRRFAALATSMVAATVLAQVGGSMEYGSCRNSLLCSQDPCPGTMDSSCQMCAGGDYFERLCVPSFDIPGCSWFISPDSCGTLQSGSCLEYPQGNRFCFVTPHSGDPSCSGWVCSPN